MSFQLERVVPWGRTLEEYKAMFSLTEAELAGSILGVGDGPASFNAEGADQGAQITSIDPIYRFSRAAIEARFAETYATVMGQVRQNRDEFVWNRIKSPGELGKLRSAAMARFIEDVGRADRRYVAGVLPDLPIQSNQFDLALCSHFLFLYSEQFDAAFHEASIHELLRVAKEVRIFPLLELGSKRSRHVEPVTAALKQAGIRFEITRVDYQFQKGGDRMLRLW